MSVPAWDDPQLKAGTMVRGALWLLTQVGVGNTFTKDSVRVAFPGVAQADRRIRDLRKYGWIIRASTEDASLASDEQRFVSAGIEVWLPSARRTVASTALTARQRREVMAADDYQCTLCGIAGGETYADSMLATAVLSVSRLPVILPDGSSKVQLTTECNRCRAGDAEPQATDLRRLLMDSEQLVDEDLTKLNLWIGRGRRGPTALDRVWNSYRRLSAKLQTDFQKAIANRADA